MKPLMKINKCYQEKLKKCLVLHIGVLLCMYQPVISTGAKCGRPGRAAQTTYRPSGEAFNEGDVIQYRCAERDRVILGSPTRNCQNDGSWSNEIPVCSKLAKFELTELVPQEESDVGKEYTADGDISTCSEAPHYNRTMWRGYLPTSVNVSAVRISVAGTRYVDLDVQIQEDDSSVKSCRIENGTPEITMKSIITLTFYCPENTVGKYVHVTCNNQALRICEVAVLLPPGPSCLIPDIPLHGNGWKEVSGAVSTYHFSCKNGYEKWGAAIATCNDTGKWSPKSPRCEEIYCDPPDGIENGKVEYIENKRRIEFKGTATFTCNEGYMLDGHSTIRCFRWNEWDFEPPVCKPRLPAYTGKPEDIPVKETWRQSDVTHCGNSPHIANGVLVINSSSVGSIARLKCYEGFRPLALDYATCLPTGQWDSRSLLCTIIECEANPTVPYGKAALLNNSSYYGSYLEIKCNQGYTSHSSIIRKCNEFGTWGDLNVCVEITCGAFTTEESTFDEWLPVNGSTYIRVIICPEEFHIEGSPPITRCLSNGSWSHTSATCKKTLTNSWGSSWTPTLMLIAAIGAGAGTAILILCLSKAFLVTKKRHQSQTNTTVFHLENIPNKDYVRQNDIYQQNHPSMVENYKNMVEIQSQSICTNSRKSHSALPNLPVDADPVYAQPFEASAAAKKTSIVTDNKKDDLYNNHIYAEPVDSRRQTPIHMPISMTISRMGTDTRISASKANFIYGESPILVQTDQQNCDKKCAIYDSSSHSTFNNGQLTSDNKYQRHNENPEFGTVTSNLKYLELL